MQERAKPDPPGYFEGESMTRRRVFTVGAQALGGLAGAGIVLPAVGFAIAPIFHRGKERWEAVGPVSDFVGKVLGGPPVRPLDRFQTRVRKGQVEVGPRFSVTSQLEPVRARDPGEFTGGVWEYLYPPRPSTFPPP